MSALSDQITSAIGAHNLWKARLRTAIVTGSAEVSVDVVRDDRQCPFGKWLHESELMPEIATSNHYQKCAGVHQRFHIIASEILSLALSGKKEEALEKLSLGQEFAKTSLELTNSMMSWKVSLEQRRSAAR